MANPSSDSEKKEKEKKILEDLGIDEDIALGYIPDGAKLNAENSNMDAPKTVYEKRRKDVGQDKVKKIVRGQYGSSGD